MRWDSLFQDWRLDRALAGALLLAGVAIFVRVWLFENPQHNPWAPLDLRDPPGWAMAGKLASIRDDAGLCREALDRSGIEHSALPPAGEGECLRTDRVQMNAFPLAPGNSVMSCAVAAGLVRWQEFGLTQAASEELGSPLEQVEHLGIFSCRRTYGSNTGNWSEHATGNAVDVAAFVLEDGRRISVLEDWDGDSAESRFLKRARDSACEIFGTVLSPDYNAAHRDHFHLDQAARGFGGYCR